MPRDDELRAAGRLAGEALAGAVDVVWGVHRAVSRRIRGFLPAVAHPVTNAQDALSGLVYSSVAMATRFLPMAGAEVLVRTGRADAPAPSDTPAGRAALRAVNGLWGDSVAARHPTLAIPMAVRVRGRDLPLDQGSVGEAFPAATARLVVFVHGLVESDESWRRGDVRGHDARAGTYGEQLQRDLDLTPVYVRYNTGRRISDNGRSLSQLLGELDAAWPTPVDDIILVGHSMGGLVARSACRHAELETADWVRTLRAVVGLGVPHLGAPLEKGVHLADWLLSRAPETQPIARLLRARSVGIKDLRFGALVEDDWLGLDPDEFMRDRCTQVPLLDHVAYRAVAATLTRNPRHPVGWLLGDGMVRSASATGSGRTRRVRFQIGHDVHVGGVGHLALLNHTDVYTQLLSWLASPSQDLPTAAHRPTERTGAPRGVMLPRGLGASPRGVGGRDVGLCAASP